MVLNTLKNWTPEIFLVLVLVPVSLEHPGTSRAATDARYAQALQRHVRQSNRGRNTLKLVGYEVFTMRGPLARSSAEDFKLQQIARSAAQETDDKHFLAVSTHSFNARIPMPRYFDSRPLAAMRMNQAVLIGPSIKGHDQ
jgi:hypothetical protein